MTPFDVLYTQLISDYRAQPEVAALLKERNLIEYNQEASPEKKGIQTADLPEVAIFMSGVRGNLHQSSSTALLITTWQYIISVGTYNSAKINTMMFGALKALSKTAELKQLTWEDRVFVKDVRLFNGDLGLSNTEQNRNIKGWVSVLSAEIDVSLLKSDLTS